MKCDGQDAALGTIVGPDGWVLTKASETEGRRSPAGSATAANWRPGSSASARRPCDLAMLKIDAVDLPVIPWIGAAGRGPMVVTAGHGRRSAGAGRRQRAPPRDPAHRRHDRHLDWPRQGGRARIERSCPTAPAETAGLKAKDIITHVNGQAVDEPRGAGSPDRRHRPAKPSSSRSNAAARRSEFPSDLVKLDTPGAPATAD